MAKAKKRDPIPWGRKDPRLAQAVWDVIRWTMRSDEVGYWHPIPNPTASLIRRFVIGCGFLVLILFLVAVGAAMRGH